MNTQRYRAMLAAALFCGAIGTVQAQSNETPFREVQRLQQSGQYAQADIIDDKLIGPGRKDAGDELKAVESEVARNVEFTLFGSQTNFDSGGAQGRSNKTGLRTAEIAYYPNHDSRVWLRYDNSLSLDNAELAGTGGSAETHYIGGYVHYQQRYTTRLEFGHRNLPQGIKQNIIAGEQVFFLPSNVTASVGAWLGHRDDGRTERIFNVGVGVPISTALRLEPTVFYSKSGVAGEKQWRGLLAGEYRFEQGYRLGGGASSGRVTAAGGSHSVSDMFLTASAPISKRLRIHLLGKHENLGNSRTNNVIALGVTLNFSGAQP